MLGSPPVENGLFLKKKSEPGTPRLRAPRATGDSMRAEYDFSAGVRGKYAKRVGEGTNLIALDPDLAAVFPDSEAVGRALRDYLRMRAKGPAI